jgi:hypothetical protein
MALDDLILCAHKKCKKGGNRTPKMFIPKREWQKFCCADCRVSQWRLNNPRFSQEEIMEIKKKLRMT